MELRRRMVLQGATVSILGGMGLAACSGSSSSSSGTATTGGSSSGTGSLSLSLSDKTWKYDATNDVYYQLGATYVSKPQAKDYETLGVYVPGKYFKGTKNSDGTYTVTVDSSGTVGGFTARTAPIVLPVNTPGYAAQKPPTGYSYSDVSSYLKAGFVYVFPGMRGKDSQSTSYTGNAPWGVTDLKAAVRYVRYNADVIPGSKDRVFVFGMSGGGAQSAVMGASGDSALFTPYLTALGAAMKDADGTTISDAVMGAMCWCPITSLDYANAAYEWNMGQFATTGTRASGTWTSAYSKDLAKNFADYTNKLGLKDAAGKRLTLSKSGKGVSLSGSYYDHIVSVLTTSLNNFLADTTFPYTPASSTGGMGGGGAPGGGTMPSGGTRPTGGGGPGRAAATSGSTAATTSSSSTTYRTAQAYIDHLNSGSTWITFDSTTNKAKVTSLEGFVKSQKIATKDVGAFDGVARGEGENTVLGLGTNPLHFAPESRTVVAANASSYSALSGWKSAYGATAYTGDFAKTDTEGKDVEYRLNMYNPMYYLSDYYAGAKSSTVAPHWRIRTGIMQPDTANTVEINLALALANHGIGNVDFATVWGLAHTMAERTGDATANFITWVKQAVTT